MPGTRNIFIGLALAIGGIVLSLVISAIANQVGYAVVATGLILVGAIQAIVGLAQLAFYGLRGKKGRANHHAKIGTQAILRSMISMAAADGQLDLSEVGMIQIIANMLFGARLDDDLIEHTYNKMMENGGNIESELLDLQSQITDSDAELTIIAIAMVGLSDGDLSQSEQERLVSYKRALRVNDQRFSVCLQEARTTLDELLRMSEDMSAERRASLV